MCRLRNIAMRDYQESVTTGQTDRQTDRQTDAGQSEPYVPLCFAGDTKMTNVQKTSKTHQKFDFEMVPKILTLLPTCF